MNSCLDASSSKARIQTYSILIPVQLRRMPYEDLAKGEIKLDKDQRMGGVGMIWVVGGNGKAKWPSEN